MFAKSVHRHTRKRNFCSQKMETYIKKPDSVHIRCKILLDLPVRSIVFFPPPLPLPGEEEEEEEAADEAASSLTSTRLEALKVNSSSPLLPAFFEGVASELSLEVRFSICSI